MATRKKKTAELDHWLSEGAQPVFVIDAERRLRVFNQGCQALTGWAADEVIGETCHYGSVSEIAGAGALAASLCPPPEVFGGMSATAPASIVHQSGPALQRLLHFFPLRDERGGLVAVMGVVSEMPATAPLAQSPARLLHAELAALRSTLRSRFGPQTLLARSAPMQRVLGQIALAQATDAGVLLLGPTGAGKEHVARVIHLGGTRKTTSFVPLDCRRLGVDEQHRVWGRILEAHQAPAGSRSASSPLPGSVLLGDVEFVPRDLQQRLVGVFAEGRPLRLFASTTQVYAALEAGGSLLPEFLALISPLAIQLPALAERADDLPLLAQHVLEELNRQGAKQLGGFDERVWPLLARHAWPGNLDELADVIRDAHAHATGNLVVPDDLPFRFHTALDARSSPPPREPPPLLLDPLLTRVETRLIALALERSRDNKSKAAELLGINRARLLRRIEQLNLDGGADEKTETNGEPDIEATDDAATQGPGHPPDAPSPA
ncbi:MAG: sigma 54-interacting transcriptional regulator [Planctomycetia bacterium]|nr:sigma 54-interacting transcriptional regulator [Planctomycetia bacterium]